MANRKPFDGPRGFQQPKYPCSNSNKEFQDEILRLSLQLNAMQIELEQEAQRRGEEDQEKAKKSEAMKIAYGAALGALIGGSALWAAGGTLSSALKSLIAK